MGVGAAFIMPSTLSILVNVFPPDERTKAISAWAAVAGCAGMIGPVASGFLLTHFWYGSVFLVNIPIVTTAFIAGWFLLPKSRDPEEAQLDPAPDDAELRMGVARCSAAAEAQAFVQARCVAFGIGIGPRCSRGLGPHAQSRCSTAVLQEPAPSTAPAAWC
jgi:MFS family permease